MWRCFWARSVSSLPIQTETLLGFHKSAEATGIPLAACAERTEDRSLRANCLSWLIQPAPRRGSIVGPRISWRELLRGGPGDRRIGRRRGGRAPGCCASRGWSPGSGCRGLSRRPGVSGTACSRRILPLLVGDKLLIARRAGPGRHVFGHAAGPGRPSVGYNTRERAASAQRQTDAEQSRQRQPALGQHCRQISSPIRLHPWRSPCALLAEAPSPFRKSFRRAPPYRETASWPHCVCSKAITVLTHRRKGFYPFAIKDLLIDLLIAPVPVQHRRCQKWLP